MKAIVHKDFKIFPVLEEVEKPKPGPGQVLLKVAGAGACHSDVALFQDFEEDHTGGRLTPPFILGHENSGWIEELGEGVTGLKKGDAYLVYGPEGCGRCRACSRGQDTYCSNTQIMDHMAVGLGADGGMAEYVVVPANHLIPLDDADPVDAAPLSDAGLTPYHAIKRVLPYLNGGGKTALVIGLGGLGYMAVQMLKAMTSAKIIATDMKEDAMAAVEEFGALTVPGGEDQAEKIRELTDGRGVDAVFDFVGVTSTINLAASVVAQQGALTVVGIAGGNFEWNFYKLPYEVNFSTVYWGTVEDLHDVVALYKEGHIKPLVERYSLEEGLEAYQKLVDGKISGRAVIVPHIDELGK